MNASKLNLNWLKHIISRWHIVCARKLSFPLGKPQIIDSNEINENMTSKEKSPMQICVYRYRIQCDISHSKHTMRHMDALVKRARTLTQMNKFETSYPWLWLFWYDTIRYEAIHIRACSFISFVQCLVDLLTRLLPHSLTRSYAKPVRSITRTLVRSLVLHGHSVFLTLALSVSLSASVVKLLKRVTHTLTNIPTMYRPFLYTCSHVSLELVL